MNDNEILAIVDHGRKVAADYSAAQGQLTEINQKVAALTKTAAELQRENTRLREREETRTTTIKIAAERSADFFIDCGALKAASRQETVDALTEDPAAVFELARQFADHVAGTSLGKAASMTAEHDGADAIVRFARS